MTKQLIETSKFLSYVLRHQPEAIGLTLDAEGWADVDALIAGAASAGRELDLALIQQIVSTNDKKRFTPSDDNSRIRAVQGHSTDSVAIQHIAKVPPALLYHGTATRNLDRSWPKAYARASGTMCTFPRTPPPPRRLASVTAIRSC
jgi:putative RNA 2'-phosphotransferase